jgi:hypothetical protein
MNFLRTYVLQQVPALGTAFYPQFIPQEREPPAAVYTVIDRSRQVTYGGTGKLVASLVNIDVLDRSFSNARALADEIRVALTDFKGDMAGTHVEGVFITGDQDTTEFEPGFFRITLTFNIWYEEQGND